MVTTRPLSLLPSSALATVDSLTREWRHTYQRHPDLFEVPSIPLRHPLAWHILAALHASASGHVRCPEIPLESVVSLARATRRLRTFLGTDIPVVSWTSWAEDSACARAFDRVYPEWAVHIFPAEPALRHTVVVNPSQVPSPGSPLLRWTAAISSELTRLAMAERSDPTPDTYSRPRVALIDTIAGAFCGYVAAHAPAGMVASRDMIRQQTDVSGNAWLEVALSLTSERDPALMCRELCELGTYALSTADDDTVTRRAHQSAGRILSDARWEALGELLIQQVSLF